MGLAEPQDPLPWGVCQEVNSGSWLIGVLEERWNRGAWKVNTWKYNRKRKCSHMNHHPFWILKYLCLGFKGFFRWMCLIFGFQLRFNTPWRWSHYFYEVFSQKKVPSERKGNYRNVLFLEWFWLMQVNMRNFNTCLPPVITKINYLSACVKKPKFHCRFIEYYTIRAATIQFPAGKWEHDCAVASAGWCPVPGNFSKGNILCLLPENVGTKGLDKIDSI